MSKKVSIHVLPVGMDERKIAILRTAFRMHQSERYEIADGARVPDVAVVDIDGPTGIKVLEDFRAHYPDTLTIIASIEEQDFGLPFLFKPLRVETLFPMLKSVRDEAKPETGRFTAFQDAQKTRTASVAKPLAAGGAEQERLLRVKQERALEQAKIVATKEKLTPVVEPPPVREALNLAKIPRFDPGRGLLGCLKSVQLNLASENVVVLYRDEPLFIVLSTAEHSVLLLKPLGSLQAMCLLTEQEDGFFESKNIPPGREMPTRLPQLKLVSVLWQLAIWTASGRLATTIRAERPLVLKTWPNFTRVALIPDAMRITAFLTRTPVNLNILYRLLNVDLHSLLNFLAAVYVTDILAAQAPERKAAVSEAGQVDYTDKHTQTDSVASSILTREEETMDSVSLAEPSVRPRSFLQKFLNKISTK